MHFIEFPAADARVVYLKYERARELGSPQTTSPARSPRRRARPRDRGMRFSSLCSVKMKQNQRCVIQMKNNDVFVDTRTRKAGSHVEALLYSKA